MTTHVKDSKGNILVPLNNLFLIDRASVYLKSESPCENSSEITIHWKDNLNNELSKEGLAIEVNNLLGFINQHGRCIIDKDGFTGFYSITIYDDYVE